MKITITPTAEFQRVNGEPSRIWVGYDDQGVAVVAHVRLVSPQTHDLAVNARYEHELAALPAAERATPMAIDMRHIEVAP